MAEEKRFVAELKLSGDIALTPEQLQAQQDEYDQWTAPSVEPIDFKKDAEEYMANVGKPVPVDLFENYSGPISRPEDEDPVAFGL